MTEMLKLQSKYFGEIEYEAKDVIRFPAGIIGFEEEQAFLLLPFEGSEGSLLCFQSAVTPGLAFVAMNPFSLKPDYAPVLTPRELKAMEVERSEELCFYALCVVRNPVGESTVNLRCPVALNDRTREAVQVILETEQYLMHHPLTEFERGGGGTGMLILQRKAGESVFIGEEIEVSVLSVDAGRVRLAIQAPKEQLGLLKQLMKLIQNGALLRAIREAGDADTVYQLLTEALK